MGINIKIIQSEHWNKEVDGLWYAHIPFEANGRDILIEFIDPDDYIQEHKEDFDALNSGFTTDTECVITADHCPTCNMSIQIKFCDEEDGEIVYKSDENGNFKLEWRSNSSGFDGFEAFVGMMGGGMNFDPSQIIDAEGKVVSTEKVE